MRSESAPLIARVALVTASVLDSFGNSGCQQLLAARDELEEEIANSRRLLADWIHVHSSSAEPAVRRTWLDVRRDCLNRRSVRRHANSEEWDLLPESQSKKVIELEKKLELWQGKLERSYFQQREEELVYLSSLLDQTELLRGITLASPALVKNVRRWREQPEQVAKRKQKRLTVSLLRYVSRAAFETSPFSTWSRLATCRVAGAHDGVPLRFTDCIWQSRGLARVRRPLGMQRQHLANFEPFRRSIELQLNNSISEVASDQYRLVRPAMWRWNEEKQCFSYAAEVLVSYRLTGPLIAWLLEFLPGSPPQTFDSLVARLSRHLDDEDRDGLRAVVERLIELGVLVSLPPWSRQQGSASQNMLHHLSKLSSDPAFDEIIEMLEKVVIEEKSFPTTSDPLASIQRVEGRLLHCQQAVQELAEEDLVPPLTRLPKKTGLFEDVMLYGIEHGNERHSEILRMDPRVARQNLRLARHLFRMSAFLSRRWEFLHTLDAFATERWPGQETVPFLELLAAALPYWRQYQDALERSRGMPESPFNPLQISAVEEMHRQQKNLRQKFGSNLRAEGDDLRLSTMALADLACQIPAKFSPIVGPMIFLQPASSDGELWMLNRLFEGTGRCCSRFTQMMTAEERERFAARYLEASEFEHRGETVELFDVMANQENHLNQHPVLTRQVLAAPGSHSPPPPTKSLGLVDLRVRFSPDEFPQVVDPGGRRLLPVHLGQTDQKNLPSLSRFLMAFGPSGHEFELPLGAASNPKPSVTVTPRLLAGPLVLRRRRWRVPSEAVTTLVEQPSGARAFDLMHRWRKAQGLPRNVFVIERTQQSWGPSLQPQYIDFLSPLFAEIFHSVAKSMPSGEPMMFEEILPTKEQYPAAPDGRPWAVELQLESVPLGDAITGCDACDAVLPEQDETQGN